MPRKALSYRQRSGSDQAVLPLMDAVTKRRRDYWLGTFDTRPSRERYHRLIAQWEPTSADAARVRPAVGG